MLNFPDQVHPGSKRLFSRSPVGGTDFAFVAAHKNCCLQLAQNLVGASPDAIIMDFVSTQDPVGIYDVGGAQRNAVFFDVSPEIAT